MDIIIELISRSKRVLERHRFTGDRITIGRAYDNDLILSDAHISEHHAVITEDENGNWLIQDLNSKNGIYTRKNQRIYGNANIKSGDELIVGKIHLRIYDRFHQVPEAVSLNPVEKFIQPLSKPWNAAAFIIFALLVFAVEGYFDLFIDLEIRHIFVNVMGVTLACVAWAAIWGFIGRVIRHDARVVLHFVIILMFLLCALFFGIFLDLLSFNSGNAAGSFILGIVGFFLLFSALVWLSLYIAISQTDRKRILMSFGITASVVAFVLIYHFLNVPEFSGIPEYVYFLKPPALQWFEPVDMQTFLEDANTIFERVATQIVK